MSHVVAVSPGSGRLQGLDLGWSMELAMGPATLAKSQAGLCPVPSTDELAPLLPEYELLGMIGRGGMGAVYRALHKKLERPVAIKVLPVQLGDEPGFAERFRRAAMTTAGLAHPILSPCLTGRVPRGVFDPPSVRNPEIDPAFDGVVLPSASAPRHALNMAGPPSTDNSPLCKPSPQARSTAG